MEPQRNSASGRKGTAFPHCAAAEPLLQLPQKERLPNSCLGLDNLDSISTRVAHVKAVCTRYGSVIRNNFYTRVLQPSLCFIKIENCKTDVTRTQQPIHSIFD